MALTFDFSYEASTLSITYKGGTISGNTDPTVQLRKFNAVSDTMVTLDKNVAKTFHAAGGPQYIYTVGVTSGSVLVPLFNFKYTTLNSYVYTGETAIEITGTSGAPQTLTFPSGGVIQISNGGNMKSITVGADVYTVFPVTVATDCTATGRDNPTIYVDYTSTATPVVEDYE